MNLPSPTGHRSVRRLIPVLLLAGALAPAAARDLPSIDVLGTAPIVSTPDRLRSAAPPASRTEPQAIQVHNRLGVPTFVWGSQLAAANQVRNAGGYNASTSAAVAARGYLAGLAPLYGASAGAVNQASLQSTQTLPNGGALVKFKGQIDGIEVFREEASVLVDADRRLSAIGGFIMDRKSYGAFKLTASDATARALADWSFGADTAGKLSLVETRDGYQFFALPADATSSDGSTLRAPARAKRVLFRLPAELVPAYYVEVQMRDGSVATTTELGTLQFAEARRHGGHGVRSADDYYAYVVSGLDGRVLWRANQSKDATYKAFVEPSGFPLPGPTGRNGFPYPFSSPTEYVAPVVPSTTVTLENWPFSRNDPWLPPGAALTKGNNVEAYADLVAPDGFGVADPYECGTGNAVIARDFHACNMGRLGFGYTYDPTKPTKSTKAQVMGAITNLFYMNNFLHDWFYDSGFDEASGNAQTNNFGRGGLGNDSIMAEAQDYSGNSNANMYTPADGARPRMQMYTFFQDSIIELNTTPYAGAIAAAGWVEYSPQEFDVTGDVVTTSPGNGCGTLASLTGKIAWIEITSGSCSLTARIKNAQAAGAVGVIFPYFTGGSGLVYSSGWDAQITIPSTFLSQNVGNLLRSYAVANTLNLRMASRLWRDGTLDNGVIAHEWGHYISNRLVGNAGGLNSNQAGGLGEGWGDFHSMLLLVKDEDRNIPSNANFNGTYATGIYAIGAPWLDPLDPGVQNPAAYYGIRRYPYSRDMAKNPLTFKHIENGVPLPSNPPPAFGANGADNAEVHNTGEVWTSMLWECYSNLILSGRLTFAQAQERMKRYLVMGYKLTPIDPTLVEARDALLAAMASQDGADYAACYQGFAKRGAGFGAVAPDRYSYDNAGVVESFITGGGAVVSSITMTDNRLRCTDQDSFLDNGELGTIVVTVRNNGTTPLSATTLSLASDNPHVVFTAGTFLSVPATQPGQSVQLSIPVKGANQSGVEYAQITATLNDPGFVVPGPVAASEVFRLNTNIQLAASATDDVESPHTVWTPGSQLPPNVAWTWTRVALAGNDHRWSGPDAGAALLTWLQSPLLKVAATGNFSFTFKHVHSFETDGVFNYDGGQLQISTNGGATWTTIPGGSLSPGYNGTVVVYGGGNPLEGQPAYVRTNASYPNPDTVTVSLGTGYAGANVLVRFLIGTDAAVGAAGWLVDDIAFTNITNKPFDVLVPQDYATSPVCQ